MNYYDQFLAVRAALLPFRVELDERGLLPLERAREALAESPPTPETRDQADRTWASVLSLEDAQELIAATQHLTWNGLAPGQSNAAQAALAWWGPPEKRCFRRRI